MSEPVTYSFQDGPNVTNTLTFLDDVVIQVGFVTTWTDWDGTETVFTDTIDFDPETGAVDPLDMGFDPQPRTVSVVTDDGNRSWDAITTWTDAAGAVVYREVLRDNGITSQTFELGYGKQVWTSDSADIKSWSLKQVRYDAEGRREAETVFFDNGRAVSTEFREDGTRATREELDFADAFNWNRKAMGYDADGKLALLVLDMDDGRVIARGFEDGTKRSETVFDEADDFAWMRIERSYDAAGALLEQVYVMDGEGDYVAPPDPLAVVTTFAATDAGDAVF